MSRPIKSTKVQRFFKYSGLIGAMFAIMGMHFYVCPPEKFTKKGFRKIHEANKMIWYDRGANPHMFGEVKKDGPFTPPEYK